MKSWIAALAALAATVSNSAWAGSVLVPIATSDGSIGLFDPAQPRSATNPDRVEVALANPQSLSTARLIRSARVVDGLIQPVDFPLLAYVKAGRLYRRDLRLDASHEPVRVSSIDDVCYMQGQALDLKHPENSWIRIARPGPDGVCSTSDDRYRLVRLSMGAGQSGAPLTGIQLFAPLLGPFGAIRGFISGMADLVAPKLELRDDSFGNPVTIADLDPDDPLVSVRQFGFATTFVIAHVAGTPSRGLYRIDGSSRAPVLSPLLHRFEIGQGFLPGAASDGQYLYFGDFNSLVRIPMNATSSSQAMRLFRAPATRYVGDIALSSDDSPRIIFNARDPNTDQRAIYAMNKDGSGEPVVLATQDPMKLRYASVITLKGSRVYLTRNGGVRVVQDDGSNPQAVPGYPVLAVPGRYDPDLASVGILVVDKLLLPVTGAKAGFTDYRLYDTANAKVGCRMGSVEDTIGLAQFSFNVLARTVGLDAFSTIGGSDDAYVVDLSTCGSLQPAATETDVNEVPVRGF
jgi:hypothetical protein